MKQTLSILLLLLTASFSQADLSSVVFFDASAVSADEWSWGHARVDVDGDDLLIKESNPAGDYGSVHPASYFPYEPGGRVIVDVKEVLAGDYTVQLLCFHGEEHIGSVDLLKAVPRPGRHELYLSDFTFPKKTQSVMFKIWVAGKEDAGIRLATLTYDHTLLPGKLVAKANPENPGAWVFDGVEAIAIPAGLRLSLEATKTSGSALWTKTMDQDGNSILLVNVPIVRSCKMTMQAVAFDDTGEYLESMDIINGADAGWYGFPLGAVKWPAHTTSFKLKVWLSGDPGGTAVLRHLMLHKP